jgi:hypothetical protein
MIETKVVSREKHYTLLTSRRREGSQCIDKTMAKKPQTVVKKIGTTPGGRKAMK